MTCLAVFAWLMCCVLGFSVGAQKRQTRALEARIATMERAAQHQDSRIDKLEKQVADLRKEMGR